MPASPPRSPSSLVALALLAALSLPPAPAGATIVSGQVTDTMGAPVAALDLDFKDVVTGMVVPTPNDDTDALGFYAVDVPEGIYDIQFEPALGSRLVGVELEDVVVFGLSQTIDQVLEAGFEVRARILGVGLLPLDGGKLDAFDAVTGAQLFSNLDRAGPDGIVQPIVPAGTWRLRFGPPVAGTYLPLTMENVLVSADLDLGDVVLEQAFDLRGRVVGSDGPALFDAHVVVIDAPSGLPVPGGEAWTDALGEFSITLLAGSYLLEVTPPIDAPYLARVFHGIELVELRRLPDLPLERAAIVSGRVVNELGFGIELVDLDFDLEASGQRVATPGDDTDLTGSFQVIVPTETYQIAFDPPPGTDYVPVEIRDVLIDSDITLPTVTLRRGLALSGRLLDPAGLPAPGVNVDATDVLTGQDPPLEGDTTGVDGRFLVHLLSADYDLFFRPPVGSGWNSAARPGITVAGPTDIGDVSLGPAVVPTVTGIDPPAGPEDGGTTVIVTGTGFEIGARVSVGGLRLKGVAVLDAGRIEGRTRPRPPGGPADVEVLNPGAAPVRLPEAFTYLATDSPPLLRLRRDGPLDNDLLLEWTAAAPEAWSVHRGDAPWSLGPEHLVETTGRDWWRDEGGLLRPGFLVYVVH